ncbi:hypothetical protein BGZ57DRAFT_463563 [Hyaloscypha finlandica]|nr:hypothetical protein BGZ57DRAFT_463563 [Hyaloscypha finlandica]
MPEHRQLASFCQYIFSSQSHHCDSHFTSCQLRTVRKAELEHTSLPHFLTSHIKKSKSPVHQRPTHQTCSFALHSVPQRSLRSRTRKRCTPLPLHMQANPAAIGQCAAAHIPGREALALSHQQHLVKSTRIAARSLALQWKGGVLAVFPQLSPGMEGTPARWYSRELWGCSRFPLPFCMVTGNICITLKRAAALLLDGPDQYCAARLEAWLPTFAHTEPIFWGTAAVYLVIPRIVVAILQ